MTSGDLKAKLEETELLFQTACKLAERYRSERDHARDQLAKARAVAAPRTDLASAIEATLRKAAGRQAGANLLKRRRP